MNKRSFILLSFVLLILSGCYKSNDFFDAPDDFNPISSKKAKAKPFNATLSFQIGMPDGEMCDSPQTASTNVRLGFTQTGNATHMGAITGAFSHCIDDLGFPQFAYNGLGTWIAANGAEVYFEYDLTIEVDFNTLESTVSGPYTIVGGTGRFANASGSGIFSGVQDLNSPVFAGTGNANGQIIY